MVVAAVVVSEECLCRWMCQLLTIGLLAGFDVARTGVASVYVAKQVSKVCGLYTDSGKWFHWFPFRRKEYLDEQIDWPAFRRFVAGES